VVVRRWRVAESCDFFGPSLRHEHACERIGQVYDVAYADRAQIDTVQCLCEFFCQPDLHVWGWVPVLGTQRPDQGRYALIPLRNGGTPSAYVGVLFGGEGMP
jgi:hypothetical protein